MPQIKRAMFLGGTLVLAVATAAPPPPPVVPAAMPKLVLGPDNTFGLFGVS
jgi:hypothetical protein